MAGKKVLQEIAPLTTNQWFGMTLGQVADHFGAKSSEAVPASLALTEWDCVKIEGKWSDGRRIISIGRMDDPLGYQRIQDNEDVLVVLARSMFKFVDDMTAAHFATLRAKRGKQK